MLYVLVYNGVDRLDSYARCSNCMGYNQTRRDSNRKEKERGMIRRVENRNKHHKACATYYYLSDKIECGYKQNYLFTKDELIVARQRALKTPKIFLEAV